MSRLKQIKKDEVAEFMKNLVHPRKDEIEALRSIILSSNTNITERIKWNAPSFCFNEEDRITFRLHPSKTVIQLIFHRGAKVKADSENFAFEDLSGLIKWAAPDRGVISFADRQEIEAAKVQISELVRHWIEATRG